MRNRLYKRIILAVFVISFLAVPKAAVLAAGISAKNVIELTNKSRAKAGLPALVENGKLSAAARDKANDMVKQDYFAHTSPAGTTPWDWLKKEDYKYKYAGENLAINYASAESQHEAWMKSRSHRDNILNANYQEIGVAVLNGKVAGNETLLTVQYFGTGFPVVASPEKKETAPVVEGEKIVAVEKNEAAPIPVPQPMTNLNPAPVQLTENRIIAPAPPVTPAPRKNDTVAILDLAWLITFAVFALAVVAGPLAIALKTLKNTFVIWKGGVKQREVFTLVIISQQDEIVKNFWQNMRKAVS